MARRWFDAAREVDLPTVAGELGLTVRGAVAGPCPSCGAERTGNDRRAPLRFTASGGWWCVACNARGDALALVASVIVGNTRPSGSEWGTVREWYAARGWAPADSPGPGSDARHVKPVQAPPAAEPVEAALPVEEVKALWNAAAPVFTEQRADRWLRARADNPLKGWGGSGAWFDDPACLVALADVARSLHPGMDCPPWAGFRGGSSWADRGWSLVLPCYGPEGDLRALRARWTGTEAADHTDYFPGSAPDAPDPSTYLDREPSGGWAGAPWLETDPPFAGKEVSPMGSGATRGTVYACPVGRAVLEAGASGIPRGAWDGRVLVVEGGPAFLRYAIDPKRHERDDEGRLRPVFPRPAVLGVWAGSWPDGPMGDALAARLSGCRMVAVATDNDESGKRYAAAILATCERAGVKAVRVKWS